MQVLAGSCRLGLLSLDRSGNGHRFPDVRRITLVMAGVRQKVSLKTPHDSPGDPFEFLGLPGSEGRDRGSNLFGRGVG